MPPTPTPTSVCGHGRRYTPPGGTSVPGGGRGRHQDRRACVRCIVRRVPGCDRVALCRPDEGDGGVGGRGRLHQPWLGAGRTGAWAVRGHQRDASDAPALPALRRGRYDDRVSAYRLRRAGREFLVIDREALVQMAANRQVRNGDEVWFQERWQAVSALPELQGRVGADPWEAWEGEDPAETAPPAASEPEEVEAEPIVEVPRRVVIRKPPPPPPRNRSPSPAGTAMAPTTRSPRTRPSPPAWRRCGVR